MRYIKEGGKVTRQVRQRNGEVRISSFYLFAKKYKKKLELSALSYKGFVVEEIQSQLCLLS